jgi:transcriptional regulator with XRE-family HTH domain
MSIGESIRLARKVARLTQAELAAKIGVSTSIIWHWEKDKRSPKVDALIKLSRVLNIPVADLLPLDAFKEREEFDLYYTKGCRTQEGYADPTASEAVARACRTPYKPPLPREGEIWLETRKNGTEFQPAVIIAVSDYFVNSVVLTREQHKDCLPVITANGGRFYYNPRMLTFKFHNNMAKCVGRLTAPDFDQMLKEIQDSLFRR